MPSQPYAITGKVYDTDGSTVVSGASIQAWNKRTGKPLSEAETTNSNGDYILDLSNFPDSNFQNGDNITVEATSGNKRVQYRTTVDTSVGFETKNLTLLYLDPLSVMIDIMDDNWDKGTTDGIKPIVGKIFDYKELDMANQDYILLYSPDEGLDAFDISATSFHEQPYISMDMRTTFKRAVLSDVRTHLMRMKRELYRIIKANIRDPGNTYRLLKPRRNKDLTDKRIGMGRIIFDLELNKWGA